MIKKLNWYADQRSYGTGRGDLKPLNGSVYFIQKLTSVLYIGYGPDRPETYQLRVLMCSY